VRPWITGRLLPWLLAVFFAGLTVLLLVRLLFPPSETRRAEAAPVVLAIQRIAQLATVEYQISDVVRYEEIKQFFLFDFPKSATLRLRGRVIGGFDLSDPAYRVEPVPAAKLIRVSLPAPRILAIDPRFEWFDERSGWINPITPQDRNRWMLWARGQLGRAARVAGVREKAAEHAGALIRGVAEPFGWRAEVSVGGEGPRP
jgi:hypothetical protein